MIVSILVSLIILYLLLTNDKVYFLPKFVKSEVIRQSGSGLDVSEYIKLNEQIIGTTKCIDDTNSEINILNIDLQNLVNTLDNTILVIDDLNRQISNINQEIDNANNITNEMEDITYTLYITIVCMLLFKYIMAYVYNKIKTDITIIAYTLRIVNNMSLE